MPLGIQVQNHAEYPNNILILLHKNIHKRADSIALTKKDRLNLSTVFKRSTERNLLANKLRVCAF